MTVILNTLAGTTMNAIFDYCVQILLRLADFFGVGYHTINVWIFCILWPIFTLALIFITLKQRRKIRRLKLQLERQTNSPDPKG